MSKIRQITDFYGRNTAKDLDGTNKSTQKYSFRNSERLKLNSAGQCIVTMLNDCMTNEPMKNVVLSNYNRKNIKQSECYNFWWMNDQLQKEWPNLLGE